MGHELVWKGLGGESLEYVRVHSLDLLVTIDSRMVGVQDGQPFAMSYRLLLTSTWQLRELSIRVEGKGTWQLDYRVNHHLHWTDAAGNELKAYRGCSFVDIALTPLCNSLPIRALRPAVGQQISVDVFCIHPLEQKMERVLQRYENLGEGVYRYCANSVEVILPTDQRGYVLDYPELFTRLK